MTGTQTRAERMRQPLASDVITATAEQHGVCVRPFTMEVGDLDTGELRYVPVPCGSTVESVCGPCARKARRYGWPSAGKAGTSTEEPDFTPDRPTADHTALLELRADLVKALPGKPRDSGPVRRTSCATRSARSTRNFGNSACAAGSPTRTARRSGHRSGRPSGGRTHRNCLGDGSRSGPWGGSSPDGSGPPCSSRSPSTATAGCGDDGTPVDPASYDYRRAARDAVHFAALVDRWWQNLRRVVGWDVQYFATVEPQKRCAPHLHAAVRGSVPHEVLRQVTAATYHQVWWPAHDELVYDGDHLPVWEDGRFVDPDTRQPLTSWAEAVEDGGGAGARRDVRAAGALQGHPRRHRRSRPAHRLPDQVPHQSPLVR